MSWLLPPLPPTFDAALRDVRARSFDARLAAAQRLAEPPEGRGSEALDGLIVMSRDLDARVRAAALRGLEGHDDLRVTDLLIAALDDGEALVREVAVVGLGSVDSERAGLAVVEALSSPHPEVRFQAIQSYLESCPAPSLSAIAPLLDDPDARVRENAVVALERFGDEALRPLRSALDDPQPGVAARAALCLGKLGEADAAPVLRELLLDGELAMPALDILAALDDRDSIERIAFLAQAFLKPLPLKVAAARALCRMDDPRGVEVLRRVMRAFRSDGRSYAAEVAGELGLASLGPELLRLARRPRGTDPEALVSALAALKTHSAEARAGLEIMARRLDTAGRLALEQLGTPDSAANGD